MAGKELYIEPILDANLSVVPGLSENIAEMTAQLNETTRILNNVIANQGLEAHQEAYNGSALSALTLTGLNYPSNITGGGYGGSVCFTTGNKGNSNITPDWVYQNYTNEDYINASIHFDPWGDASTCRQIKIPYASHNGFTLVTAEMTLNYTDGTSDVISGIVEQGSFTFTGYGEETGHYAIFDIDTSDKRFASCSIKTSWSAKTAAGYYLFAPILINEDGGETEQTLYCNPKIIFNSANALAFETSPNGTPCRVWATSAKITLPDIATVGSWAVFLTNGNLEGADLALIDNTSNEVLLPLPAATSDISSLVQTSNLALKVTFAQATNVINSIAQRYY